MSEIKKAQDITFPRVDDATWKEVATASLKGRGTFASRLVSTTLDGFDVQPLYTQLSDSVGFPGVAPFTRGSTALPNADEAWEIRQEFAHPDLKTSNEQLLRDLSRGVSGAVLVFDEGFSRGTDNATSVGLPVRSRNDMRLLLDGAHLSMIGIDLEAGINAHAALALLVAQAEASGTALKDLRGTVGYDPLSQLTHDGSLPLSKARLFDLGADLVRWTRAHAPNLRPIAVGGRTVHEAGASEGQEIGWQLAAGIEWMRALIARGISADDAAQSITFRSTVGRDIFLEIGKLRALRKTWARALEAIEVTEQYRAINLHVRGSSATLSQRDPWVNLLRVTGHTYSAALVGAQSITTPSYDDVLAIPVEFGRRMARNTQLILRDESHLRRVHDAVGGSYYFEELTQRYADIAWTTMQKIEASGGAIAWAISGALHDEIAQTREKRDKDIATRKMPLTGVSEYPNLAEKDIDTPPTPSVSPATNNATASQTEQAIAQGTFDGAVAQAAIQDVQNDVLASAIFRAIVEADNTLSAPAMPRKRYARQWEALRDGADAFKDAHGDFPQAFLACVGRIPEHRARATFAQNLFGAAGINAPMNDGWETIEETVAAFKESEAPIACICSTDARYQEIVEPLAQALRAAGAKKIVVAGNPGNNQDAWTQAGVDTAIFMGCNALNTMRELLLSYGVTLHDN